jgi:hypothetical protein
MANGEERRATPVDAIAESKWYHTGDELDDEKNTVIRSIMDEYALFCLMHPLSKTVWLTLCSGFCNQRSSQRRG